MAHDIPSMATAYVRRGWKVIQLHDVTAGRCSCWEGPNCLNAGKHPVNRAWQLAFIDTEAGVAQAWAGRPAANVGIVTGPVSGIWVLDVDPKHDGHNRLAELVARCGPLPDTYTVGTGSGGTHYYFSMTDIDFDLTNSRGSLSLGLDVRGRGGFVVAPPSVSGIGAYRTLSDPDADVARFL